MYETIAAAVYRNPEHKAKLEGNWNSGYHPDVDPLYRVKYETIVDEEIAFDETSAGVAASKSTSPSQFTQSRIRRVDDGRFTSLLQQDKSSKIMKSVPTEDKFTTIDDFDCKLRIPGKCLKLLD